VSEQVEKPVF